jgi:hypothetical protein
MKFLCLAYGREEDWLVLPDERKAELLRQDDVLRERGAFVAMLGPPTTVTAHDGPVRRSADAYTRGSAPLVGFSLVDAADVDEAVALVAGTPCAVAGGAIEVRPLTSTGG